jgi:hypothetical protein
MTSYVGEYLTYICLGVLSNYERKKHMLLVIPIVLTTAATLFILALLYFLGTKCKKGRTEIPSTMSMHDHPLVSYAQLAKVFLFFF